MNRPVILRISIILIFILSYTINNLYAQTYTFTNAGAIGRYGPDQLKINSEYTNTLLSGKVKVDENGIQRWIVPKSGLYRIEARGAQGGGTTGGLGAKIAGEFDLNFGDTLYILVGQKGISSGSENNMTGGGGSFVVKGANNTPLLIAGGGGGSMDTLKNANGTTSTSGQDGIGVNNHSNNQGSGGSDGDGGGGACWIGGGGGFNKDGGSSLCANTLGKGGLSFLNGGLGGEAVSDSSEGGFGGGGSSERPITQGWSFAGGGGGYSGGGAAAMNNSNVSAGGGGSLNNGDNAIFTAGYQSGDGVVIIKAIHKGAYNDAGVYSIDEPNVFCPGNHDLVVTIQNFGINLIDSVIVNWSINSVIQTSIKYLNTLDSIGGSGSFMAQVNLGSYNFSDTIYNIYVWTSEPNGTIDTIPENDTLIAKLKPHLPPPTLISSIFIDTTQAIINWIESSSMNSWLYTLMPMGKSPDVIGIATNKDTVEITGLYPANSYDFYVREVCSAGDTSNWAGPYTFRTKCKLPLNGAYTIDKNSLPSNTNFTNFSDVTYALNNCGVSSNVTFNIKSDTYYEQILLKKIHGVSDTSKITFRGEGAKSTKLLFQQNAIDDRYTVRLDSASWITFEKMTIEAANDGIYGWGVHIKSESNNITFENCSIISPVSLRSSYNSIIASSSNFISFTMVNNDIGVSGVNNILIKNTTVYGGFYGVCIRGLLSSKTMGIEIQNSEILEYSRNGIFLFASDKPIINNNSIKVVKSGSIHGTGIQLQSVSGPYTVSNNLISGIGVVGIYLAFTSGTSTEYSLVYNNMIGGGFKSTSSNSSGIYLTNSNTYISFYYNSINVDDFTNYDLGGTAFHATGSGSNIKIKNNSFVYSGPAKGYAMKVSSNISIEALDYNNYYTGSSSYLVRYLGFDRNNLAILRAANNPANNDSNSISVDPGYLLNIDLRVNTNALAGKATPLNMINKDIFNSYRDTINPWIGAFESLLDSNDAGVIDIGTVCSGTSGFFVKIKNFGQKTLQSVEINWSVNEVSQTPVVFNNINIKFNQDTLLELGVYNFSDLITHNIIASTSNPNGVSDENSENDTFQFQIPQNSLSGTYVIGGKNSDYKTILKAVSDLNKYGVCGPVLFNIMPGTYNEQLEVHVIKGASNLNTVTFKGAGAENTKIEYLQNIDKLYTFRLNGASWLILDSLTIKALSGNNFGRSVHIKSASSNIIIRNCSIITQSGNNTTLSGIISSDNDYVFKGTSGNSNILIDNTYIDGGSFGIYFEGLAESKIKDIVIQNSTITNNGNFGSGILLEQTEGAIVNNNNILLSNAESGINFKFSSGPYVISNNVISEVKRYGIVLNSSSGTPNDYSMIYNNMIGGGFTFSSTSNEYSAGILLTDSSSYLNIYYNSINLDNESEGRAFEISDSNPTNIVLKNNTFVYSGLDEGYAFYVENASSIEVLDHNNYYTSDSNKFIYYNGNNISNISDLKSVNNPLNNDLNSIAIDPEYISNINLKIKTNTLVGKATPISNITKDFEGNIRDSVNPWIGAFEAIPDSNDAGITGIEFVCDGLSDVYVWLRNYGQGYLNSVDVDWIINGDTQSTVSFNNINLAPETDTLINIGNYLFSKNTSYNIILYSSNPNGVVDENPENDQHQVNNWNTILNGNYIIGGNDPDFNTITEAVYALDSFGICGPVFFKIEPGIYNEQIVIGDIKGTTSVNTITFKGSGIDSTIISYEQNHADSNYTINFVEASWIIIDSLTIEADDNGTYGTGILMTSGSNNILINNCNIVVSNNSTSINNQGMFIYVEVNANKSINKIKIDNSVFYGGYYNIRFSGSSNLLMNNIEISNSDFFESYSSALAISYTYGIVINNNIINKRFSGSTFEAGILFSNNSGPFVISNNILTHCGRYGIYLSSSHGSSNEYGLIYNNMIGGGFRDVQNFVSGIRLIQNNTYIKIYHNSINLDNPGNGRAIFSSLNTPSNIIIKNNSFVYSGTHNGHAMYITNSAAIEEIDHNNYYTGKSSNFVFYNGNEMSDLASLRSVNSPTNNDQYSISIDPEYLSKFDLRTYFPTLFEKGIAVNEVTDDIYGNSRDTLYPNIGAFEHKAKSNDIGVRAVLSPANGVCPSGYQNVLLNIINYGLEPQLNFPIKVKVFFGTSLIDTLTYQYTDTLHVFADDLVNVGNIKLPFSGTFNLTAFTNLNNDQNRKNDTVHISFDTKPLQNPPQTQNVKSCTATSFDMIAVSEENYNVAWYDSLESEEPFFIGDTLNTPLLNSSVKYYVSNLNNQTYRVGPEVNTIGSVENDTNFRHYLIFDVYEDLIIDSVTIYSATTGVSFYEIEIRNLYGNLIDNKIITLFGSGRITVYLGFEVKIGNNYSISINPYSSVDGLGINTDGANYPYEIPGVISIKGNNTFNDNYYFYFYNWFISSNGCPSEKFEIKATIHGLPQFSLNEGILFEGTYNKGTETDPDLICNGSTVIYELSPNGMYDNDGFGKYWQINNFSFETKNGFPPSDTLSSPPLDTNNATFTLNANSMDVDSTYILKISIFNLETLCDTTITRYIQVNPVLNASFEVSNSCLADSVYFLNTTSIVSGELSFNWNFGDSLTSTEQFPAHKYSNYGIYNVSLDVSSDLACFETEYQTLDIFPQPVSDFNVPLACYGNEIQFENTSFITSGNIVNHFWNFGDGSTSIDIDPFHYVFYIDTFNVSLVVVSDSGCTDSVSKNIKVLEPPFAYFEFNNSCGEGNPIQFINYSLNAVNFEWKLGNEIISTLENPVLIFNDIGEYELSLIAYSNEGCQHTQTQTVKVYKLPKASFSTTGKCITESINFTSLSEINADSAIFTWNFGDGNYSNNENPIHQYSDTGTYNIKLIVENNNGCIDSVSSEIEIKEAPSSKFIFEQDRNVVAFIPVEDYHVNYFWSFGDGNSSNEVYPENTYTENGMYFVTLVVTNEFGCESLLSIDSIETTTVSINPLTVQENQTKLKVYPNPFKGITTIEYNIEKEASVSLKIFDIQGREVSAIITENQSTGNYVYVFGDSIQKLSGLYFVVLSVDNKIYSKKIIAIY